MRLTILFFAMFLTPAQTPTGLITGTVRDESDALIVGSQVRAVNKGTGLERTAVTGGNGAYAFISLPAGEYEVSAQLEKMRTVTRTVTVATGASSTSDFILLASEIDGVFTVVGVTPEIRHDSYSVSGSITPEQIEAIPLNGRGFQDLNKTQPGGQQGSRASSNRNFAPILGAPGGNSGRGTVVTIDGASIMAIGNGGSALGFSQEGVREFQVSSANFDLSTGLSLSGSINVTTRYGTKDVHGSAFWYFRDHNLSAYPAITRDPANPDPFFQRRQFGFALGGPIRRKTSFFFVNWERNDQRGVGTTTVTDPDLAGFSRITPSPFMGDQINVRLDANLSPSHTGFFRYSHDGNHAFGPPTNATNAAYPSSWSLQSAWVDQGVAGVTSAFPSMVNDLRLSYFVASTKQGPARTEECLYCLGIGAPVITVFQTGLTIGGSDGNTNLGRRFQLNDVVKIGRAHV